MRGLLGVAYPAVPGWIFFALAAVGSAIVGMAPMIVARKRVERMEV